MAEFDRSYMTFCEFAIVKYSCFVPFCGYLTLNNIMTRVYFRPLKKGVVLPLAIVKKG